MGHVGKIIAVGVFGTALIVAGSAWARPAGFHRGGGFHGGGLHGGGFRGAGIRGGGWRGGGAIAGRGVGNRWAGGYGNRGWGYGNRGWGAAGVGLGLGVAGLAGAAAAAPYYGGYGYGGYGYGVASGYPGYGDYGYGTGGSYVAPDAGSYPVAQETAPEPLTTGRSVATSDPGNFCSTPVKTCQLYETSWIGNGCSCKVTGGRARGSVTH